MAVILFILGIVATAAVLSLIPVKSSTDLIDTDLPKADYHFVPFAGSAFGA